MQGMKDIATGMAPVILLDPTDKKAAVNPPVGSLDVWPLISGQNYPDDLEERNNLASTMSKELLEKLAKYSGTLTVVMFGLVQVMLW